MILIIDWPWRAGKLDSQKFCHDSCFSYSSFSGNDLYTDMAILRAASLASGSLSFSKLAAAWTSGTNPNSCKSLKLCNQSHNCYFGQYQLKKGKPQELIAQTITCDYHSGDTIGDGNSSFSPDPNIGMAGILLKRLEQRKRGKRLNHRIQGLVCFFAHKAFVLWCFQQ